METILCPLTSIDVSGVERIVLTLGSLLSTPADPVKIEQALSRVTLQWRLLAGRVEWDPAVSRYAVRVPLGALTPSYATYAFTSISSPSPAPFPIPNLTPKSAKLNHPPPRAHFRAKTTPGSIDQFAKQKAPLVQVHVETWENCQTVGLTVPHGVLDGIGLGMVIKAIEAELHGLEWTAPHVSKSNLLAGTLERAAATCEVAVDAEEDERRRLASGSAKSVVDMTRFVWSIVKEKLWYGCTPGGVFVGREVMERIVRGAKEEARVQTEGREWVSTGDVLVAWTIKTLYSGEPSNDNNISTAICYNIRPLLSSSTTEDLSSYPHNALALLFIDPIAVSALPSTSLATLALSHRRSLTAHLTLPHLLANLEFTNTQFPIPARRSGTEGLNVSNQIQGRLPGTRWGAPKGALAAWWEWGIEEVMDHTVAWNETEAGWVLTVSMRAARWKAVEAVLEELERDEAAR